MTPFSGCGRLQLTYRLVFVALDTCTSRGDDGTTILQDKKLSYRLENRASAWFIYFVNFLLPNKCFFSSLLMRKEWGGLHASLQE